MTLPVNRMDQQPESFDEDEITTRLKAGDMSACTACVNAHSDSLYRLAYRLLKDEAAAEDVVQETFLNAFKALDKFDGRSKLSTWLFRIAYNNALMRLRAQRPTVTLEEESDGEEQMSPVVIPWRETPEDALTRKETRETLDQAISTLPASLRAVFELRDVQQHSTLETAEILGVSEANVKVRLHRARLALREKLNGYFGTTGKPEQETMTCEEVAQYLSDYIDNELEEPLNKVARDHIATCPRCHILVDTMQDTIVLCREGTKRVIPEASQKRIFGEIKSSFAKRVK